MSDIISRGYKLPSLLNLLNLCFHRFNQEGFFFHSVINKTTLIIDMVGDWPALQCREPWNHLEYPGY